MSTTPASTLVPSFPLIVGEHWIETLSDGSRVLVRPLREDDRQRERDFIDTLPTQDRRFRFLGEVNGSSSGLIDQLMAVDDKDAVALIALAHVNGTLTEVGIARYAATPGSKGCECAVTVASAWQHKGLAVILMRHLIDAARRNGFETMFSIDASENEPMQELAHFLGFERRHEAHDATQVLHSLAL